MASGGWRRSGSAGNHYRVGCGGRHSRALGWRKPSRAGRSKALEKRGREMLNEGEETRSPKRKGIRVESDETQDNVREEKSTEHEDEEERTFVPSAVGVPAEAFVSL